MTTELLLSDIVKNQAIINVGCIGHVSNGKSTLVRQMTGIKTQKFKSERERNCTINVGYGNCKIYHSKITDEYKYTGSHISEETDSEGNAMELIHHISFVDCPGHENYMSNMLCGTSVIDMAFLVEAANAPTVPQPQTLEHLIAIQNSDITDIVVLQNKCDLVSKENLELNKRQIDNFIEDHCENELPIIPVIAQTGANIEYIGKYLANTLNQYNKDINLPLQINIIRTFDINRPNKPIIDLKGGVMGGSVVQGIVKVGDILQISPGICKKTETSWSVSPLFTKVESLCSEKTNMNYAIPGGLIGVGTTLDPAYTKANQLVGQIITRPGEHLKIVDKIVIKYKSFRRVNKVDKKLSKGEVIKLGIICKQISGTVLSWDKKSKEIKVQLACPACINKRSVSIMKKIGSIYKIFSIGKIVKSDSIKLSIPEEYIPTETQTYKIVNNISDKSEYECFDYDTMKDKLNHTYSSKTKLVLPNPMITRTKNGSQQVLHNYEKIINSIINENDTLDIKVVFERMMADEISCPVNTNEKNKLLIHGKVKPDVISNTIAKIVSLLRKCITCNGYKTYLKRELRSLYICCEECTSEVIHKL